jgi:DNA repair exonuclease SbcCD nuclease subunit
LNELMRVGDDYATRAGDIPAVSYGAFGHIRKPQEIGNSNHARYAGSPTQIDFGEEGEGKSFVFVEANRARRGNPVARRAPPAFGHHDARDDFDARGTMRGAFVQK